jgi:hypothetical protein
MGFGGSIFCPTFQYSILPLFHLVIPLRALRPLRLSFCIGSDLFRGRTTFIWRSPITESRFLRNLFAYGSDPDGEWYNERSNRNLKEISTGGKMLPA